MITPFFAPQSHAAVFRAHKLSKYLARKGWQVHVVTVGTNYNYNEDESLAHELPEKVVIHRVKYVEPTLRGLRMAFGGRDRTYRSTKSPTPVAPSGELISSTGSGLWQKFYKKILFSFFYDPDPYWTWANSAKSYCANLVASQKINLVYTTSMPYSTLKIGSYLKKKCNIKWVADFRDPLTYNYRNVASSARVLFHQKNLEKMALETADVVTGLSSSYNLIYRDMYGLSEEREVFFIPTGVDDDYVKGISPIKMEYPYIVFVGEYLKEYGDAFFKIFSDVVKKDHSNLKFLMIGNMSINSRLVANAITNLGLSDSVILKDHMPQKEVYRYVVGAKAAVLLSGKSSYWWTNFAKLTDYIGLKVPVIAFVPQISEARKELTRAKSGIFVDSAEDILSFLRGTGPVTPDAKYCEKYLASSMCESFEKIFLDLSR